MARVSITIPIPFGATKDSLMQELNRPEIPANAQVGIRITPKDRPFDSDQHDLVVTFNI